MLNKVIKQVYYIVWMEHVVLIALLQRSYSIL